MRCSADPSLSLSQRLLWTPVGAGAPAGAGDQRVPVAVGRQPVQGARHLLLLLGDGDVYSFSYWEPVLTGSNQLG